MRSRYLDVLLPLRNESGAALFVAAGMALVGAVIGTAMVSMTQSTSVSKERALMHEEASVIQASVVAIVTDDASWERTIAHDSQFDCLKTQGAVCPAGPKDFTLYMADDSIVLQANSSEGFTLSGDNPGLMNQKCTGFGGDPNCMFTFKLQWEPMKNCGGSVCPTKIGSNGLAEQPEVAVYGTFSQTSLVDKGPKTIDPNRYDFGFVRNRQKDTLAEHCRVIGGVFDQDRQFCQVLEYNPSAPAQGSCPPGEVQYGMQANGTPYCLPKESCEPLKYLAGFNPDGTPFCKLSPMSNVTCPNYSAIRGISSEGKFLCSMLF